MPIETVTLPKPRLAHLLLCAFRYSLGRRTYITRQCREWLEQYWSVLPDDWQRQIIQDIKQAISRNQAGMESDVQEWEKVLRLAEPGPRPE